MEIKIDGGIRITDGEKKVILDPTRQSEVGIVTHGHMDHLIKDAYMTRHTLDILGVRMGERRGKGVGYGFPYPIGGFDVTFHPAGHVFGSSMIMVEDVLYTGDFNPAGGLTCGRAEAYDCGALIIETTYGKPEYSLPFKDDVLEDMISWTKSQREEGPVVFGAYEFGKAQEIIAILNGIGEVPHVPDNIADICDIYNKHGVNLKFKRGVPDDDFTAVVTPRDLKDPVSTLVSKARDMDGSSAYLSGWCAFYPFFRTMDIDAQFPLSDHAGFEELIDYVEQCDPDKVYTVHGSEVEFAEEVKERFGIEAEPLHH